jgi:hypothetical protein
LLQSTEVSFNDFVEMSVNEKQFQSQMHLDKKIDFYTEKLGCSISLEDAQKIVDEWIESQILVYGDPNQDNNKPYPFN